MHCKYIPGSSIPGILTNFQPRDSLKKSRVIKNFSKVESVSFALVAFGRSFHQRGTSECELHSI